MIDLYLARRNNYGGVCLRLPATPAEVGEAYAMLDTTSRYAGDTKIVKVICPIMNLCSYIQDADIRSGENLQKLNFLAERIGCMSISKRNTFEGALSFERIDGLDDVLKVVENIEDYVYIEGVASDRKLGEYMVDHGFLPNCPESVKPYLDVASIGAEYCSKCGGAYTAEGFVLRKESAIAFGVVQVPASDDRDPIFKLHLRTTKDTHANLNLPATEDAMEQALRKLDVDELAMASIDRIDYVPYAADLIPNCCISVEDANELALAMEEMKQLDGELMKFFSALEVEKPGTFPDALRIAQNLDDYERVTEDAEYYAREHLKRIGMDQEMMDTIEGFLDFEALGDNLMLEDGVVETGFGFVRRLSEPFTSPSQGGIQMR